MDTTSEGLATQRDCKDATAPVIYAIDSSEHPFDISDAAGACASAVIPIPLDDWNDALTPWPAPGFYEDEPWFGGHSPQTLARLAEQVIPSLERERGLRPAKRALCGYSLGGLFALYAFLNDTRFDACACISGSLWYQGWMDYVRGVDRDLAGRFAFLSVGKKERRSGLPLFRCVEDNMNACANLLRTHGCEVDVVIGPGNHMQHIPERFYAALTAVDAFLARGANPPDTSA